MRERLTNPKRLNKDLEALDIVDIDGMRYRTFTQKKTTVETGSCQCYKDCDCASSAGKVTTEEIQWFRNVDFDGTDKCFYSEPFTPKLTNKSE